MQPIGETGVAEKVRLGWFSGENLAILGWASPPGFSDRTLGWISPFLTKRLHGRIRQVYKLM